VLTLIGKPCPLLIESIAGKLLPSSTAPKAGRAKRVYVEGSNDEDDSDDMHENACFNPKPNGKKICTYASTTEPQTVDKEAEYQQVLWRSI